MGKRQAMKIQEKVDYVKIHTVDKLKVKSTPNQSDYFRRAGMFIGLIGAICFSMAMLTFQLDWLDRYDFMLYFIPIPFFSLMLARKLRNWLTINPSMQTGHPAMILRTSLTWT